MPSTDPGTEKNRVVETTQRDDDESSKTRVIDITTLSEAELLEMIRQYRARTEHEYFREKNKKRTQGD